MNSNNQNGDGFGGRYGEFILKFRWVVIAGLLAFIEMGTRLNDWWSLDIEFRGFFGQENGELLFDLRDDDLLQIQLTRHI